MGKRANPAGQWRFCLSFPNLGFSWISNSNQKEANMKKIIIITGASSGFGALTARALAKASHTVYASMRETNGRNAPHVEDAKKFAKDNSVDLRAIELDVASQGSVDDAIQQIIADNKRLDVVIHNAGHMVFGPAEAFTPEQLAELYDVNVLSTQRVNRTVLPQLRKQKRGLVIWVSSSSAAGGTPPYLAPYFAAKAAMDALAVVYARELTRWGIETSIIVPGAFTAGTNHFAHAGSPADKARVAEYDAGPYADFGDHVRKGFASIVPPHADASAVADAIVKVVDTQFGKRPFRVHIDPTQDGAEVVNAVSDRVRAELLRRIGLGDLLTPRDLIAELQSAA
jgi:NAD(P)-dependent dehydrogenase (short-subunit alcohol dehydrogenase family)